MFSPQSPTRIFEKTRAIEIHYVSKLWPRRCKERKRNPQFFLSYFLHPVFFQALYASAESSFPSLLYSLEVAE